MPRFLEIAICLVAQCVAAIGILIGFGFVNPLFRYASAVLQGQPWQGGELARLVACVCGPIFLGLLVIAGLTWHLWSSAVTRKRMRIFPDQPWMWRADWAKKRVQLSNRVVVWFAVLSATFYGLVAVPLGIYLASRKNAGLVYSFLGVVVFILLIFFRIRWINRRWNRSDLQLETLPGVVGGTFSGVATIPESFPAGTVFRVALRCDQTRSTSSNPNRTEDLADIVLGTKPDRGRSTLVTTTIYEDHRVVSVEPASHSAEVTVFPISFQIPGELPSSGKSIPACSGPSHRIFIVDYIDWRVQIKLDSSTDLREVLFEIPVFEKC